MGPYPSGPLSKQVAIELYSGLGPFSGSDRWRFAICVILSTKQDPLDSYLQDDTVEDVNVSQSILCLCLKRCQCEHNGTYILEVAQTPMSAGRYYLILSLFILISLRSHYKYCSLLNMLLIVDWPCK